MTPPCLPPCLAALALVATTLGAAGEGGLQPLRYQNPGLVVDLGVGLWAWPLPLDVDGDGDLDLLVACPDRPSHGVYRFENPSQDRRVVDPVFKPGVRLGAAVANMQLSRVNGRPRILIPGHEIPRDPQTGRFDFAHPRRIYPRDRVHPSRVRANQWRYADYDGDGDADLIVGVGDWSDYGWDQAYDAQGRWRNGPLHGWVTLLRNTGSNDAPHYADSPEPLRAGGGLVDVYGMPSPNLGDFDGDGDLDLLCGEFRDGFTYFENTGTRRMPHYASGRRLRDASGHPLVMHLQMITPTACDWDGDGDLDLVVGDEDGRVALVEHTGHVVGGLPVFHAPRYFRQEADTLKFGALATPWACDWDGDGDEDLLCGNTAGEIGWFENRGAAANGLPRWAAPRLLRVRDADGTTRPFRVQAGLRGSIQGPCEAKWGYTTLSAADWDGDGDPDIVYNSIHGRLGLLRNDGLAGLRDVAWDRAPRERPPVWDWRQVPDTAALTQWRTTPVTVDFDADGRLDLVLLDQTGTLCLRRGGGAAERVFVDPNGAALRLNPRSAGASGRVKLAVVDWDGDGRLDLLVNSENARWYRNLGTRDGRVVLHAVGNLARRNLAGHTSSPAACDLDRDGKPDLLVGAEDGRLYYRRHDDCLRYDHAVAPAPAAPPAPRFPGWVSEDFVFTDAPFAQCHASTLCETSRGLVAAWFGGTREGAADVGIWSSYHDGGHWSRPRQVADGVQHEGRRYPCWNPVLYQGPGDAPTLLFFKVGPNPRQWWGEMLLSYDRGRTFRERRRLPEGILGPVRCKPLLLDDGATLLCGSSTEPDGWRVHLEALSLRGGRPDGPWRRIGPLGPETGFDAIQPTFLRHQDGSLGILCRTKQGVVVASRSCDRGRGWSDLAPIDLPNPNAGIDAVTLDDGRHLLVYNHLGSAPSGWGRRGLLNMAVSEDDGRTWRAVAVLEREAGAEFSYPAVIRTADGRVHITYTWKRRRIKHVVVDPQALHLGPVLTRGAWPEDRP